MPIARVDNLGQHGIITDDPEITLPLNAWTAGRNVRFFNNSVERFTGHSAFGTPSVTPYWICPTVKGASAYWVYAGLDKVYSWNGTTHTNITRQTAAVDVNYTGSAADKWNGGNIQGVLVVNNGVDDPQMWVNTKLESLQWDGSDTWSSKGYTARVVRPYKTFLVALRWDDGSQEYPQSVYWSDQADPLSVPADWDYADPANEAGIATLAATSGYILDGASLRDTFVIYKEDSFHVMQYVGGTFPMTIHDLSRTTGALAQGCMSEFFGRHIVFANDDILVHDGQSIQSIAGRKIRRAVFSDIDPTNYAKAFVVRNLSKQEVWCCYPAQGDSLPTKAAVWNWRENTWGFRDLPGTPHIDFGVIPSSSEEITWDSDSASWDSDTTTWDERLFNPSSRQLVGVDSNNILAFDSTNLFDGGEIASYVTREGIDLGGQQGKTMIKAVYPRGEGSMSVSVGAKHSAADAYTYEGPYTFTPGEDYRVPMRVTGRFHAIKFGFPASASGRLDGYDIEFDRVGMR